MLSVGREGRVGVGFPGGRWGRLMGPLMIYKAVQVIQLAWGVPGGQVKWDVTWVNGDV